MQIYQEWRVPPNLQRHLLTVAALADTILSSWSGPLLNRHRILRVLLLHDIGNIVKFDYDSGAGNLEEEQGRIEYWKQVQAEIIALYGTDDHVVSQRIAKLEGLSSEELELLGAKVFQMNDHTVSSNNYELKIAAYSDQRVAPQGVMPLLERLNEAKDRYKERPGSSMNNPKTDFLIECAVKIESQLALYMTVEPATITQETVAHRIPALRDFIFKAV